MKNTTHIDDLGSKTVKDVQPGNFEELPAEQMVLIDPYSRMIELAVESGNLDQLQKFMELKERHEANEARKAFNLAMAAFKADPPEILKTAHVKYKAKSGSTVDYWHAELGKICDAISKGLSKHNLYARWDIEQPDANTVKTTCILSHNLGHSESVFMTGPPDNSGGKEGVKAVASTNTVQQRLTLLAITGLAAIGMDIDGGNLSNSNAYISEEQQSIIKDLIKKAYGENEEFITKFFEHIGCTGVSDIPVAEYQQHKAALEAIAKKRGTS
jgi:hypothetical protein